MPHKSSLFLYFIFSNLGDLSDLPPPDPHFVNREEELRDIKKHLRPDPDNDCRCVFIRGAVGMGKTTTAIKAANEILETNHNTAVLYVNCRYVNSLDDLAEKIAKQVYHFPLNEPTSEVKSFLANEDAFYTVLLLDNFEYLLNLNGNRQASVNRNEESAEIMKFIAEIVTASKKVNLLVTSSEDVVFPGTGQQWIKLHPFQKEHSFQLLKTIYGNRAQVEEETAYKIADACGGVPLALHSLASWQDNPVDLVEMITTATSMQQFELFTRIPHDDEGMKIGVRLDACFDRLDAHLQDTLISFTLFRGLFTEYKANEVFHLTELTGQLLELAQRSLLEQNIMETTSPTAPCWYSLLTVIKLYCQNKALEARFYKVYDGARKMFIEHYLAFLEETFKMFLSKDASRAIITFRQEEEDIMQLLDWFGNGAMAEDQTQRCIDVFNKVGELLAKMLGKKQFETIFSLLKKKCEGMGDQERLSESLTSLGINEVFSCSCSPGLCYEAAGRAKKHLMEADRIQTALGINTGNSRAQCLAKLGRCLTKEGNFHEGKDKIHQAIDIRLRRGEEDSVMLGATYNDLAGEYRAFITIQKLIQAH